VKSEAPKTEIRSQIRSQIRDPRSEIRNKFEIRGQNPSRRLWISTNRLASLLLPFVRDNTDSETVSISRGGSLVMKSLGGRASLRPGEIASNGFKFSPGRTLSGLWFEPFPFHCLHSFAKRSGGLLGGSPVQPKSGSRPVQSVTPADGKGPLFRTSEFGFRIYFGPSEFGLRICVRITLLPWPRPCPACPV